MTHRAIDVRVPTLTRVEGEGALHVSVDDGVVSQVRLDIYEPPRFFEAFLRGRSYREPVDITARICGICPVAYQMSAANALEAISGVTVGGEIRELRRLLYAGEWIESHVLHIGFLHAPDFLDASSGMELASRDPEMIRRVLRLKKLGNDLMEAVGGRPIHPVNVQLGGFYRAPERSDLVRFADELDWGRDAAERLARWVAGFDAPDVRLDHELVSLRHPSEYAVLDGRLVSDRGLDIAPAEFDDAFVEFQVEHSTALHARRRTGARYLTGPLARWANNHDRLPDDVAALADELGVPAVERNPFRSIVVRALEVVLAIDEARSIIERYRRPEPAAVEVMPRAGVGWGASEAPRGVLVHRYETDSEGIVRDARIIPPTAQNQAAIESDVRTVAEQWLADSPDPQRWDVDALRHRCEVAIRNHDPCISCAAHFLDVEVDAS